MGNQTPITEFFLFGLSNHPQVQRLLFFVFLIIYAATLFGNLLIILIIRDEPGLHIPMFFFLSHLAFLDICFSSVSVPKMLENFLARKKTISTAGCIIQMFFYFHFGCADTFLLSAMAYDRYNAICNPLHYSAIMKKEICRQLVGGAWLMGILVALVNVLPLFHLTFCRQKSALYHYVCEPPAVLKLSCSEMVINYIMLLFTSIVFGFTPFLFTLISYVYIVSSILKIHSAKGRSKAFSTCSSHLIVVCMFYFSALFRYLKPSSSSLTDLDRILSVQYTAITPMLNPVIYSLKNKEIKATIWKVFRKYSQIVRVSFMTSK